MTDARSAYPRLTANTRVPDSVSAPIAPPTPGIVHLGVGAFHRAHQAVYTQDAIRATGDSRWGIIGVTQRSRRAVDELAPQDYIYGVLTVDGDTSSLDLVGSIVEMLDPSQQTPEVLHRIADEDIHVVTITATEKAYKSLTDGSLNTSGIHSDLDALLAEAEGETLGSQPATSMVGMLVRGLAARHRSHQAPITVLSCDNISSNGHLLQRLVLEAANSHPDTDFARWLIAHVTFPDSMVDRIAPATTDAARAEAAEIFGAWDEALVVAEPFRQWVIEDRFAGPRPPWHIAGATFVEDVSPYEEMKLRMLNGTHSILAYVGASAGLVTIDQAVSDPRIVEYATRYLTLEAIPSLRPPAGIDLPDYADTLLHRFANRRLNHTIEKVGADGSMKIPQRWVPVALNRLRANEVPTAIAVGVAAWVRFIRLQGDRLADPLHTELAQLAQETHDDHTLVDQVLALRAVFPAELSDNAAFTTAVHNALADLPEQR